MSFGKNQSLLMQAGLLRRMHILMAQWCRLRKVRTYQPYGLEVHVISKRKNQCGSTCERFGSWAIQCSSSTAITPERISIVKGINVENILNLNYANRSASSSKSAAGIGCANVGRLTLVTCFTFINFHFILIFVKIYAWSAKTNTDSTSFRTPLFLVGYSIFNDGTGSGAGNSSSLGKAKSSSSLMPPLFFVVFFFLIPRSRTWGNNSEFERTEGCFSFFMCSY